MYLDNVIKSAQTANMPEISYSEIIEDALHMVEVEGAGQLALLKAEATNRILGSEAPADWWAKIKTVARKIFEMLKNLITKVFAFIKSVPSKLATVANRIAAAVINVGLQDRVKRLNSMGDKDWKDKALKNLEDREFDAFYTTTDFASQTTEAKNLETAVNTLTSAIKTYNTTVGGFDKDREDLEEAIQTEKEKVIKAQQAVSDAEGKMQKEKYFATGKGFNGINKAVEFVTKYAAYIKNKKYASEAAKISKAEEDATRDVAKEYRLAMSAYERAVKDENEEKVKAAITAAKNYRWSLSVCAANTARKTRWLSHDLLLGARLTSAILASVSKKKATEAPAGQQQ
jgi:hypothetical protein